MDGTDESETETGEVDTTVGAYDGSLIFEQEGAPHERWGSDRKKTLPKNAEHLT